MDIVVPAEYQYLYKQGPDVRIVKVPDPVLRKKAVEIPAVDKKVQQIADDMMKIMKKANGVGLAGPQVGLLKRIIVIAPMDMRPTPLINPVITKLDGEQIGIEGCLSIPGLYGDVKRAQYVEVTAFDKKGREIELELEGLPARVVQHEVDHLEGVLFIDKVDLSTLHWAHPDLERAPAE